MGNYISLSSSEKASPAIPTPITSAPIKIINESETDNVIVSSSSDEHEQHSSSSSLLEKEIKNEEECKEQVKPNETNGSDIVFRKQILKNKQNKQNKQNKNKNKKKQKK
jgi:hypothetical protein